MKKLVLSTIAALTLSSTLVASEANTMPIETSTINQISKVNVSNLEKLKTLVLNAGGVFETVTENGVFKSLSIRKDNLHITITPDSTVLLEKDGMEISSSLKDVIAEFRNI